MAVLENRSTVSFLLPCLCYVNMTCGFDLPSCAEFQEDHFLNEFSETSFGIWLLLFMLAEHDVRLILSWLKINQIIVKDYFKT